MEDQYSERVHKDQMKKVLKYYESIQKDGHNRKLKRLGNLGRYFETPSISNKS